MSWSGSDKGTTPFFRVRMGKLAVLEDGFGGQRIGQCFQDVVKFLQRGVFRDRSSMLPAHIFVGFMKAAVELAQLFGQLLCNIDRHLFLISLCLSLCFFISCFDRSGIGWCSFLWFGVPVLSTRRRSWWRGRARPSPDG